MPIRTDVVLRRAERDDLDTIVDWMAEPDFLLFLYGDPARSPKQIREHVISLLGRSEGYYAPAGLCLVLDSPQDGPVGLISLQNISWRNRSCNLDVYMGDKKRRASVLAGMCVYRALDYCFNELNLHRVNAYVYAFNEPSWRLLELTGAVRELTLREHVARDGALHDLYCYGLLRPEFARFKERIDRVEGASLADMIAGARPPAPGTEASR